LFFFDTEKQPEVPEYKDQLEKGSLKYLTRTKLIWGIQGKLEVSEISEPHHIAGLLRLFFKELPYPLLLPQQSIESQYSHALGEKPIISGMILISSQGAKDFPSLQICMLRSILFALPVTHRVVLQYMLSFLNKLIEHSAKNKMTTEKVARTFGPIFVPTQGDELNSTDAIELIRILLVQYDPIFGVSVEEKKRILNY
jgi:hypothetical protein